MDLQAIRISYPGGSKLGGDGFDVIIPIFYIDNIDLHRRHGSENPTWQLNINRSVSSMDKAGKDFFQHT
jgi:hypothetical protein